MSDRDRARIEIEDRKREMVTVRNAMRTMNKLVEDLETGRRKKVVLTRSNCQMRAVVLSVDEYARLKAAQLNPL